MEIKFENVYKQTLPVIKAFFKYTFFKTTPMILCDVLLIAAAVFLIATWIMTGVFMSSIVIIPMFLILQVAMFFKTSSSAYKRTLQLNGGNENELSVSVTDKTVTVVGTNGTASEYRWDEFKKLVKMKEQFLLVNKAGQSVVLPVDSFTKGTPEEFEEYVRSKKLTVNKK